MSLDLALGYLGTTQSTLGNKWHCGSEDSLYLGTCVISTANLEDWAAAPSFSGDEIGHKSTRGKQSISHQTEQKQKQKPKVESKGCGRVFPQVTQGPLVT
jgi:hypothetical protein